METSGAGRSKGRANLIGTRLWENHFGSGRRNAITWMFAGKCRTFRIRPVFRGFPRRWDQRRLGGSQQLGRCARWTLRCGTTSDETFTDEKRGVPIGDLFAGGDRGGESGME